jgi:cytochrome c-type biogenesis protein CcmH/NrfG
MEFNPTSQTDWEMRLAEPHFDEEATLLSARPVVPLEEIVAVERSGKKLVFGVALVVSVIVGSFGGALIYKQRGQKQSVSIIDRAVSGVDAIAVDEPLATPSAAETVAEAGTGTLPDNSAVPAEIKSVPSRSWRVVSRVETKEKRLVSVEDERALRRAERIEARRLRRKSEREEARRYRDRTDDVLRIREIFEGSRRP